MVELNRNFKQAINDLVWLLDRGYPKRPSIELVGNRYMLGKNERQILLRGVFDRETCKIRRKKIVKSFDRIINAIIIDGLNVLISIHSYLLGKIVFKSLDGFVRDISGVYGNFTYEDRTKKAFDLLIGVLTSILKITEKQIAVYLFLDYRVSKIGDFAMYMRSVFSDLEINGEVTVDRNCDYLVVEEAKRAGATNLVATSDTVIIDKVNWLIDIPYLAIVGLMKKDILDIKNISGLKSIR